MRFWMGAFALSVSVGATAWPQETQEYKGAKFGVVSVRKAKEAHWGEGDHQQRLSPKDGHQFVLVTLIKKAGGAFVVMGTGDLQLLDDGDRAYKCAVLGVTMWPESEKDQTSSEEYPFEVPMSATVTKLRIKEVSFDLSKLWQRSRQ